MSSSFMPWLIAVVVCGVAVWNGSVVLRPVRDLLVPMWLPLSVLIVAAIFLFATDQGQDLGVGLLGNGHWQLFLLACALVYWATGSWHTARLGLIRRFGTDERKWPARYKPWLRWLPRLLGACAHFFASLSLALAARHAIDPAADTIGFLPVWLIAFVPPAAIVLGTLILWLVDQPYVAAKRRHEAAKKHFEAAGAVDREAAQTEYHAARRRLYGAMAGSAAAALAICILMSTLGGRLPAGLAAATYWVLASAITFLLVVSFRNHVGRFIEAHTSPRLARLLRRVFEEADNKRALSSTALAILLSAIALWVAVRTWLDPVSVGEGAGSMVIGFFAFGAYIAVIDLVRICCDLLPDRNGRSPHKRNRRSGARFAAVCVFLLLLATATSATRDFHRIRLCGDARTPCAPSTAAGSERNAKSDRWVHRPTVAQAAKEWYRRAATGTEGEPVPMLVIATAGGGIRAAYWTAVILQELEDKLGRDIVRRHLFAISGVSGGSVGAAAYMAATAANPATAAHPVDYLAADFLAPAIAATAFIDGPSSFLPELGQGDRGYALERAWEVASADQLALPFLSFFPSLQELESGAPWRPALLLNATHQDTGRRVITSHLQAERHVFLDSFDAHDLLKEDMPASTAAHNSARFTYVSPAGKLVPRHSPDDGAANLGFLLDGGYFENFGALTALQLVREARRAIHGEFGSDSVRPVILQISSDPSLTSRDRPRLDQEDMPLCDASATPAFLPYQNGEWQGLKWKQRDGGGWISSFLNELTAPLAGIMASRVAHGTLASQELAYAICTERRPAPQLPQGLENRLATTETAPLLDIGFDASGKAKPTPEADWRPEFAHFAMCDDEGGAIVPPLGWALSPLIRRQFTTILEQCGNPEELKRLIGTFRSLDEM